MNSLRACLLSLCLGSRLAHGVTIRDAFNRDVSHQGIVLLDWQGYMANPAIKLTAEFESSNERRSLDIRSDCARLIFDREGDTSTGPLGKSMRIAPGETKAEFWVSIFPDRDGKDEDWTIELKLRDDKEWTPVKVRVVDQDRAAPVTFRIHPDFSRDQTGFLKDKTVRQAISQAASDWSYFIGDMNLDEVAVKSEKSVLWTPEGFVKTYSVLNSKPYTGFLLYFTGIKGPQLRSGGAPSYEGRKQTINGKELPLFRSGAVEVELQGSYTKYGWNVDCSDANWWASGSQASEPADLYSIILHEMGHAIGFETSYPLFGDAQRTSRFEDPKVRGYLGYDPPIDVYCHFDRCVDPASGFGVFGSEFQARMKVRRWLITKAHLLLLQAIGYKIKPVSCFDELAVPCTSIILKAGKRTDAIAIVTGGVPAYHCSITAGKLPEGMELDERSGKLEGTPRLPGKYEVTVKAADQSPNGKEISRLIAITVEH